MSSRPSTTTSGDPDRGPRALAVGAAVAVCAAGVIAAGASPRTPAAAHGARGISAWTSPQNLYPVLTAARRVPVSLRTHVAVQISATRGRLPAVAPAYGWPLKPFDRQHPVRGNLNDPRIGAKGSRAFHFGVDVAAPDGTPVYAVQGGVAHVLPGKVVIVVAPRHAFGYWHIRSAVRHLQHVRTHELIGWILRGWGHVHLAERRNGVYLNPLRPGGMGPYLDRSVPRIAALALVPVRPGVFALGVAASDAPWPPVPGPWRNEPVAPALVRWSLAQDGRRGAWRTAVDFRSRMLPRRLYGSIYAPPTLQNHKGLPGRYWIYLTRGWHPRPGRYRIEVAASDVRGNRVVVAAAITVNGQTPL